MLVTELPTKLLKPYAKSRVEHHVQTIAFIQLVHRTDIARAMDFGLCENVTTTRERGPDGKWTKHTDVMHGDHASARAAFLSDIATAEKANYVCLTSSGIFMPMNETDLKHFRTQMQISRAALEYGTALFDQILRWYVDEKTKAAAPTTPAAPAPTAPAAPSIPPPSTPSVLSPGTPAESAAAGDDFAASLVKLEETLAKIEKS